MVCVCNCMDIISELPDDFLAYILSLLPFREATATQILSTRWRRLSTAISNVVVSLKCPFPVQLRKRGTRYYSYGYYQLGDETQFSNYLNWVNHTLNSYKGNRVIKKISVDIPYTKQEAKISNSNDVNKKLIEFGLISVDIPAKTSTSDHVNNKLLEIALSREIEIIEIRVVYSTRDLILDSPYIYNFSTEIMKKGSTLLPGLKCLKELCLYGVAMYNSDIRVLVSNLVVLERLLIESSEIIPYRNNSGLCIDGPPTSKLKHLVVSNVGGFYIANLTNLVSLKCDGLKHGYDNNSICLHNLTKLVHLRAHCIETADHYIDEENFPEITCSKGVKLQHLDFFMELCRYETEKDQMFNKRNHHRFTRHHLKHLEINVVVYEENCDLHQLFSLIEACPRLKKLEIKFIWSFKPKYKHKHRRLDGERINRKTTIDYLNMIKLSEFRGSIPELEFVLCVINNGTVLLEEVVLESCVTNCAIQQREIAHSFKHLISLAPTSIDLILK